MPSNALYVASRYWQRAGIGTGRLGGFHLGHFPPCNSSTFVRVGGDHVEEIAAVAALHHQGHHVRILEDLVESHDVPEARLRGRIPSAPGGEKQARRK